MRRKLVKRRDSDLSEITIETTKIMADDERRDQEITLWNLILDYVIEQWPEVKLNHMSVNGICVVGTDVIIGKKEYNAVDPNLFKYIDDACRKGTTLSKGSRRLKAKWSIEAAEDLKAIHDIDIEKELMKGLRL